MCKYPKVCYQRAFKNTDGQVFHCSQSCLQKNSTSLIYIFPPNFSFVMISLIHNTPLVEVNQASMTDIGKAVSSIISTSELSVYMQNS